MTEADAVTNKRPQLSVRSGSSRKLLARKALEKEALVALDGEALEARFPRADASTNGAFTILRPDLPATATGVPPAPTTPAAASAATPAPAWSAEDESAFQILLAKRKAAGYQRRGRDVGGQLIAAGSIRPNPNTVVAVIVGIVAERGSIKRAELIEAMAETTFPHAKAQPTDKGWCQGYVAGALRNGFLSVAEQPVAATAA